MPLADKNSPTNPTGRAFPARLGHEAESYWYIGERQIAVSPALEWNELYPSALGLAQLCR